MPLPLCDLHSLGSQKLCLTDASSIAAICDHASTLTTPLNDRAVRLLLESPDAFDIEPPLAVLERWIVTEGLAVDVVALDSLVGKNIAHAFSLRRPEFDAFVSPRETADVWQDLLECVNDEVHDPQPMWDARYPGSASVLESLNVVLTVVPPEVAETCFEAVARTSRAMRAVQPHVEWDTFGFGPDKSYGEELGDIYGGAAFLARSNFGVERTLYYYELAGTLGVPVSLHPCRGREAHLIASASLDAYHALQNTLRTALDQPLRERLPDFGLSWRGMMPPLAEALIREAGRRGASILEIAHEFRSSEVAVAFRSWLAELQNVLNRHTPASVVEAARTLKEIESVVASWVEQLDFKHNVIYRRRHLNLTWLPRIGSLLGMLSEPSIKDPILNPKGHLAFISSWYDSRGEPGT